MHRFFSLTLPGLVLGLFSSVLFANVDNPAHAEQSSEGQSAPAAVQQTEVTESLPDNITLSTDDERLPELPGSIVRLLEQGMTLESRFDAGSGLTGWLLSVDDRFTLLYSTSDHQMLISGTLLDSQGLNLSEQHMASYLPRPDVSVLEQQAHFIQQPLSSDAEAIQNKASASDATQRVLYVFFDPLCPFCRLSWQAFQPYVDLGAQVRWVPVAFLQPNSRMMAEQLINAEKPETALTGFMQQQVLPQSQADQEKAESENAWLALQSNMKLMQRFGLQGTPSIVWQDSDRTLQTFSGMPQLSDFPAMTGLPEQKQTAPELARFR